MFIYIYPLVEFYTLQISLIECSIICNQPALKEADPKGQLLFFLGGVRKVQEDNNGKLNPSHFVGPSRSQGHGRPWFSLCYPPEPLQRILK